MASIDELKAERIKKLNELENRVSELDVLKLGGIEAYSSDGIEAYPAESEYTKTINSFLNDFDANSKEENILVGRVMGMRKFGALAFAKIFDGTGSVQIVFEEDHNKKAITFFDSFVDTGDFVQVTGTNYITKKGENSLLVSDIKMLSKALLPLPDKHSGLQDEEEKMRKRYLDILLDENKKDLFYKKAKFWSVVRSALNEKGFLEVETPTIEVTTGGAEARPFKTHHNDYDMEVYMRICIGELWQKRLMAAGFPRTYEIGRAYRNEGSSPEHLQEFTNCEMYMAYADYKDGMKLARELYIRIAQEVFGTTAFVMKGHTFDLAHEWPEIDYATEVKKQTDVDIWTATDEEMKQKLKELNVSYDGENRERLTDTLWKYCRKSISGPAFLVNHPLLISPLAKPNPDGKTAQQFQPIIAGSEVGRGYTELNDPRIQRANFEQQQKLLDGGDEEAMMPDYDFVEMLEHGMPPTCGFALGDRLFAFLAGLPIRETQLFPLVKPKDEKSKNDNKKKIKVVNIVLNKEAKLENWQTLNTVGHLSAEFAAKVNKNTDLFFRDTIETKDNQKINLNIQHAIVIKETETTSDIFMLMEQAKENNVEIYAFTREMLNTTNDKKVIEQTKEKNFRDIEFLGVLVFGEKEMIDKLTGGFELYK